MAHVSAADREKRRADLSALALQRLPQLPPAPPPSTPQQKLKSYVETLRDRKRDIASIKIPIFTPSTPVLLKESFAVAEEALANGGIMDQLRESFGTAWEELAVVHECQVGVDHPLSLKLTGKDPHFLYDRVRHNEDYRNHVLMALPTATIQKFWEVVGMDISLEPNSYFSRSSPPIRAAKITEWRRADIYWHDELRQEHFVAQAKVIILHNRLIQEDTSEDWSELAIDWNLPPSGRGFFPSTCMEVAPYASMIDKDDLPLSPPRRNSHLLLFDFPKSFGDLREELIQIPLIKDCEDCYELSAAEVHLPSAKLALNDYEGPNIGDDMSDDTRPGGAPGELIRTTDMLMNMAHLREFLIRDDKENMIKRLNQMLMVTVGKQVGGARRKRMWIQVAYLLKAVMQFIQVPAVENAVISTLQNGKQVPRMSEILSGVTTYQVRPNAIIAYGSEGRTVRRSKKKKSKTPKPQAINQTTDSDDETVWISDRNISGQFMNERADSASEVQRTKSKGKLPDLQTLNQTPVSADEEAQNPEGNSEEHFTDRRAGITEANITFGNSPAAHPTADSLNPTHGLAAEAPQNPVGNSREQVTEGGRDGITEANMALGKKLAAAHKIAGSRRPRPTKRHKISLHDAVATGNVTDSTSDARRHKPRRPKQAHDREQSPGRLEEFTEADETTAAGAEAAVAHEAEIAAEEAPELSEIERNRLRKEADTIDVIKDAMKKMHKIPENAQLHVHLPWAAPYPIRDPEAFRQGKPGLADERSVAHRTRKESNLTKEEQEWAELCISKLPKVATDPWTQEKYRPRKFVETVLWPFKHGRPLKNKEYRPNGLARPEDLQYAKVWDMHFQQRKMLRTVSPFFDLHPVALGIPDWLWQYYMKHVHEKKWGANKWYNRWSYTRDKLRKRTTYAEPIHGSDGKFVKTTERSGDRSIIKKDMEHKIIQSLNSQHYHQTMLQYIHKGPLTATHLGLGPNGRVSAAKKDEARAFRLMIEQQVASHEAEGYAVEVGRAAQHRAEYLEDECAALKRKLHAMTLREARQSARKQKWHDAFDEVCNEVQRLQMGTPPITADSDSEDEGDPSNPHLSTRQQDLIEEDLQVLERYTFVRADTPSVTLRTQLLKGEDAVDKKYLQAILDAVRNGKVSVSHLVRKYITSRREKESIDAMEEDAEGAEAEEAGDEGEQDDVESEDESEEEFGVELEDSNGEAE